MSQLKLSNARKLAEASVMLALATVLSLIKLVDLPYGGSVTIACMLPIVIVAYRHGTGIGLLTGFVFGVIQQLLGLKTLSYVTSWQSVVAVILLDYIVAFMVIGLGGIFKKLAAQPIALTLGSVFIGILRYICHVISGCTVWAGLSIPTNAALVYSLGYNATYMIPETIVTALLAYYIGTVLDFNNEDITRLKKTESAARSIFKWLAGLLIVAALTFDVASIFSKLQNAESGDFDITGLSVVNWPVIAIVSVIAAVGAAVLFVIANKTKSAPAEK